MLNKIAITLLLGPTAAALTIKPSMTQPWYYALYTSDHIECQRVSDDLMKCPTNGPNLPASYEKETAKDLATWDLYKDCIEISENISLCDDKK